MESNPIVEQRQREEAERRAKEDFRYPFRVVCVFEDADAKDFPIIHEMRDFCAKNNVIFVLRQYDIDRHSEDMVISRLPAFHVVSRGYVEETHYHDLNPVYKVLCRIWEHQDKEKAREQARRRRQENWNTFVAGVQSLLSLERFKRKPALNPEACLQNRDS